MNDGTFQRCRKPAYTCAHGKNSAFGARSVLRLLVLCGQRLLGAHRELTEGKAAQRLELKAHAGRAELFILCSLILHYITVGCIDLLFLYVYFNISKVLFIINELLYLYLDI